MRPVKDAHLTIQKDRDPASCPLLNFGTQFSEETFNITPLNIAAGRSRKDQFNNPLVPSLHHFMVLIFSTKFKTLWFDEVEQSSVQRLESALSELEIPVWLKMSSQRVSWSFNLQISSSVFISFFFILKIQ